MSTHLRLIRVSLVLICVCAERVFFCMCVLCSFVHSVFFWATLFSDVTTERTIFWDQSAIRHTVMGRLSLREARRHHCISCIQFVIIML